MDQPWQCMCSPIKKKKKKKSYRAAHKSRKFVTPSFQMRNAKILDNDGM